MKYDLGEPLNTIVREEIILALRAGGSYFTRGAVEGMSIIDARHAFMAWYDSVKWPGPLHKRDEVQSKVNGMEHTAQLASYQLNILCCGMRFRLANNV